MAYAATSNGKELRQCNLSCAADDLSTYPSLWKMQWFCASPIFGMIVVLRLGDRSASFLLVSMIDLLPCEVVGIEEAISLVAIRIPSGGFETWNVIKARPNRCRSTRTFAASRVWFESASTLGCVLQRRVLIQFQKNSRPVKDSGPGAEGVAEGANSIFVEVGTRIPENGEFEYQLRSWLYNTACEWSCFPQASEAQLFSLEKLVIYAMFVAPHSYFVCKWRYCTRTELLRTSLGYFNSYGSRGLG